MLPNVQKEGGGGASKAFLNQKALQKLVLWDIFKTSNGRFSTNPQGRVEKLEHNDNSSDPDPVVKRSWSVGEVIL